VGFQGRPGRITVPDISGYVGRRGEKILEDKFFVEILHAPSVLFFHQEKSFQDLFR
jgi:hypothetical protein